MTTVPARRVPCALAYLSGVTFTLTLVPSGAHADTLRVPSEFPTIQAAIDAAAPGDEVLVAPGTYPEQVTVDVPHLTLRSETDGGALVQALQPVMTLTEEAVTLRGFRIDNTSARSGSAVYASADMFRIEKCEMAGGDPVLRVSGDGTVRTSTMTGGTHGVELYEGTTVVFEDCDISFNGLVDDFGYGGVVVDPFPTRVTDAYFYRCRFVGNRAWTVGGGIFVDGGFDPPYSKVVIEECLFAYNRSPGAAAVYSIDADLTLRSCTLVANETEQAGGTLVLEGYDARPVVIDRCIMASNLGPAMECNGAVSPAVSCTNVFGNTDNAICGQDDGGNMELDPLFCDVSSDNFELQPGSPCAPEQSPLECGLIGALPVTACATSVTNVTWGQLKDRFFQGRR